MAFEWDERKRASNLAKHGVDFRRMEALFESRLVEIEDDRQDYGETRFTVFGEIEGRVYAVVYTWRGSNRRIISARRANGREQKDYYARNL
jgi:uncharacterized DUF497 family protein